LGKRTGYYIVSRFYNYQFNRIVTAQWHYSIAVPDYWIGVECFFINVASGRSGLYLATISVADFTISGNFAPKRLQKETTKDNNRLSNGSHN
jgi:hypothetical protein